jgi:uncharacterized SAM-binding protein YcdF (DUF218 family)
LPSLSFRRPRWRTIWRVTVVIVAVWVAACGVMGGLIVWAGDRSTAQKSDVIIVLGAGLRRDGAAGDALYRRSVWAARAYQDGLAPVVICTGGQSETQRRSEAEVCRELLLGEGVPTSAIVLEDQSRSTEENAINARRIMAENGWQTAILVTDAYHILRANLIFEHYDLAVSQHPVPRNWMRWTWYSVGAAREIVALHWLAVKQALNLPYTDFSF